MKKAIIIGVTSGIAAYKSLDLIKLLKHEGLDVFVIMTHSAAKMVAHKEFEKASGNKVFIELFDKKFDYKKILKSRTVEHIDLADKTAVMVVCPATANSIAKISHGFADDFLTTTLLAVTAPIIICPSMNVNMWNNPAVQENLNQLRHRGHIIVEPSSGMLACGYEGVGRLTDIKIIKDEVLTQLSRTTSLKGKKILITSGGTQEKIDDVRFITNRSSGKMGVALAEECYLRGGDVTLLRAKNSVKPRYLINEELFNSFEDLSSQINKNIKQSDIIIHCAAVSDFSIKQPLKGKISSDEAKTLHLEPRAKLLDTIKKINPKIFLIAFKAEYRLDEDELIDEATKRLEESNADVIIANDIGQHDRGFESDKNEVIIVTRDKKPKKLPHAQKHQIAKNIFDFLTFV